MKKAIYLLALALGTAGISAQAQKNTFLVYGNVDLGYQMDRDDNRAKGFALNLGVGYQFSHNWTIGVEGGYNTFRVRPDGVDDWALSDAYRFGPFVRYTKPVNKIIATWVQAGVSAVGGYTGTTDTRVRTTKYTGTYSYIKPGVSVFFCDRWALNFDLGGIEYASTKNRGDVNRDNSFNIGFGQQFNAGVSVNIGHTSKAGKFKKHRNSEDREDGYEDWKRRRHSDD